MSEIDALAEYDPSIDADMVPLAEAAAQLCYSKRHIRRLANEQKLQKHQRGKKCNVFFSKTDIAAFASKRNIRAKVIAPDTPPEQVIEPKKLPWYEQPIF